MKFQRRMPAAIKPFFQQELKQYKTCLNEDNWIHAWYHLERAHVIGQAYPMEHSYVHWLMLDFGLRIKDWKEILGQIPRLLVGGVKSFVGRIPTGNTGGANVPPLKPMPIPSDIQQILASGK